MRNNLGALYQNHMLFSSLETLCILGNLKLVDHFLDRSVHEDRKIVHRVVDTMVGHA